MLYSGSRRQCVCAGALRVRLEGASNSTLSAMELCQSQQDLGLEANLGAKRRVGQPCVKQGGRRRETGAAETGERPSGHSGQAVFLPSESVKQRRAVCSGVGG